MIIQKEKDKKEILTNESQVWLGENTNVDNLLYLIGSYVFVLY